MHQYKNKRFKIDKIRKIKWMISQIQIFEIKSPNPSRIKLKKIQTQDSNKNR